MHTATLYIAMGYPGSGKTHFGIEFCKRNQVFHLNADRLRLDMFPKPKYDLKEHKIVFRTMDSIALSMLEQGISVYYDANVNTFEHREEKRRLAKKAKTNSIVVWVKTPINTAKNRSTKRQTRDERYFRDIDDITFERISANLEEPQSEEAYIEIDGFNDVNRELLRVDLTRNSPK